MDFIIRPGCLRLLGFEIEIVLVEIETFPKKKNFLDFHVLRLSNLEINQVV